MGTFFQDLRYGLRLLSKQPFFTSVIIIVLAIGVGVSTALYSIIDGAWIHRSIYTYQGQWVALRGSFPRKNLASWFFSVPEYNDVHGLNFLFSDIAALRHLNFNLTDEDNPERIFGAGVTANAFSLTGVQPLLGRTFFPEEDKPGGERVVVISHRLWERRYLSDPNIIGKPIKMNNEIYTVIGVMPHRYLLWGADMWVPLALNMSETDRSNRRYWIAALLKPGISLEQANAELNSFAHRLEQEDSSTTPEYTGFGLWAEDVGEATIGNLKTSLLVLLGAVGLVLLISCANVGSLLLARAIARRREIAIRTALGASRARIVRQLLTESLALSFLGGIGGFLIALWSVPLLVSLIPPSYIATEAEIKVNFTVLLFTLVISLLMGLFFGLVPSLQSSKPDFVEALKEGSRRTSGDRSGRIVRNTLIVTEIALSLVVLIGTGLVIRSYMNLTDIDLGFNPKNVLTMRIALPETKYRDAHTVTDFYQELIRRVATMPGVEQCAVVSTRPMAERSDAQDLAVEGRPLDDAGSMANAFYRIISPDYFQVMGIRLLNGRSFTPHDDADNLRVAIINQTMAKQYWPDSDPVGKRFRLGGQFSERVGSNDLDPNNSWVTIAGVVTDAKQLRVIDGQIRPEFYLPQLQRSSQSRDMALIVRTVGGPSLMANAVGKKVQSLDMEQPVFDVLTLEEIIDRAFGPKRLTLVMLTLFAGMSLILATIGLYAVMAYSVSQRIQEIGIRMAVGAQAGDVLKLIMGQGIKLAAIGIVIGVAAAFSLTRVMSSLLYGVSVTDIPTFAVVPLLQAAVALLACLIPALRATKVDPMVALRHE